MSDNPNQQAAWLLERVGYCTASQFKHLLPGKKGGYLAKRDEYKWQLVTERLTGRATEHYVNAAMQWGIDQEGFARAEFVQRMHLMVDLVGFIKHPTLMAGASPDAIVSDSGGDTLVEFKCPTTQTHLHTIMNGMDPMHMPQLQGQMWMTGAKQCYFVSYDPRLPRGMDFFCDLVYRDQAYIDNLESEVRLFLSEVDGTIEVLQEKAK